MRKENDADIGKEGKREPFQIFRIGQFGTTITPANEPTPKITVPAASEVLNFVVREQRSCVSRVANIGRGISREFRRCGVRKEWFGPLVF